MDKTSDQPVASPAPLRVTNHALLRYLERHLKLDIEQLRADVLPQDALMLHAITVLGNGTYPVGDSHRIVVKDNTVVTVLPYTDKSCPPNE